MSKPTAIVESSLQSNYCINFDNEFINRFSKVKALRVALVKQEKEPKILKLLDKLETPLTVDIDPLSELSRLLIMMERLKGW